MSLFLPFTDRKNFGKALFPILPMGSTPTIFFGISDFAPSIAFSVRQLNPNATNCIRVRRSSDNTETDIGFDSNGELDQTSLTTFVGAGNGFVTIWYDQTLSGNDAKQTTSANQPQIVSSGTVLTLNGKPCINFNSKRLDFIGSVSIKKEYTLFTVLKVTTITGFGGYFQNGAANGFKLSSLISPGWRAVFLSYDQSAQGSFSRGKTTNSISGSQYLETWIMPNAASVLYENANIQTVTASIGGGYGTGIASIGSMQLSGTLGGQVDIQECVMYNTNQSLNLSTIESNINLYFNIY